VSELTNADMFWIGEISYDYRVTSPGTGYCRVRILEDGVSKWNDVNIFTNTVTETRTLQPDYIGNFNKDLQITFELAVDAEEYNAEISNISIESRYRSATKVWE